MRIALMSFMVAVGVSQASAYEISINLDLSNLDLSSLVYPVSIQPTTTALANGASLRVDVGVSPAFSSEARTVVNDVWGNLPASLRERMAGIDFVVSVRPAGVLASALYRDQTDGLPTPVITVYEIGEHGETLSRTVMHELGHAISAADSDGLPSAWLSNDATFRSLAQQEGLYAHFALPGKPANVVWDEVFAEVALRLATNTCNFATISGYSGAAASAPLTCDYVEREFLPELAPIAVEIVPALTAYSGRVGGGGGGGGFTVSYAWSYSYSSFTTSTGGIRTPIVTISELR